MGQSVFINFDTENLRSARCRAIDDLRNQKFTQFVVGDSIELDLYLTGTGGELDIQDYSEIRVGMGNLDDRPESGSYVVAGSETLAYNHSASDLQTAVASATAANITTELTGFVFKVQFNAVGAQTIPTIDNTLLQPRSTISVTRLIAGDATTKEVWLWRLFRDPLSFTNTFTNIANKGVRGNLSLATAGLYELIAQSSSVKTFFEVELTSSTGNVRTVLQAEVALNGEVIGRSFSGSVPSGGSMPAEATAFLQSFPDPDIVGDLSVGGLDLSTGAAAGYVLTSDATGTASWQSGAVASDKGFFNTPALLAAAYPTGQNGWYAVVATTDTFWIWDSDTTSWVDSSSGALGTVTSIGITDGTGITASGTPVTSSGSITVGLDTATQTTLADVANKSFNTVTSIGGGTAYIGGDQTGNDRGADSLDIQSSRDGIAQIAKGGQSIVVGSDSLVTSDKSYSFGRSNEVKASNSLALGENVKISDTASASIVTGRICDVDGTQSVVYGSSISVASDSGNNVAVGKTIVIDSDADSSVSMGTDINMQGSQSAALGYNLDILKDNSCAIGRNVRVNAVGVSELGGWSSDGDRDCVVRCADGGVVSSSLSNVAFSPLDGGTTAGDELATQIPREMVSIRRNGDEVLADVNIAGVVKTVSFGDATRIGTSNVQASRTSIGSAIQNNRSDTVTLNSMRQMTQAAYTILVNAGEVDANTVYIIVG